MPLPASYEPYTDVYFLRSLEILQKISLNPFVRAQVFFRKGPGKIYGMNEALEIIKTYSKLLENGGRIFYLAEGEEYQPEETVLLLEGRIQDIIFLETMILGVLSAETTKANDKHGVNLESVTKRMKEITTLVGERPVFYFGARHWRYDEDEKIANAAFKGGAAGASTNIGAQTFGKKGAGTIPHSLENIFAWKYGINRAVVESTKAFNQIIDPNIPRIALVDYANMEVDDALATAIEMQGKLSGVRVDTCGENMMQGADSKDGKGVTTSGVYNLRQKLDRAGFNNVQIFLSSGFGEVAKVKAFVDAEKKLGVRLFDSLGVGEVFDARTATMDVVGVGETIDGLQPVSKVGRRYRSNGKLVQFI